MSGRWVVTDVPAEELHRDEVSEQEASGYFLLENVRTKENGELRQDTSKWMSGAWPVNRFDDTLPTNKRKAEWFRFRDQFERIISCKGNVDSLTKLTALKIHAGPY